MSLLFQLVPLALFSCIGLTHGAQKYFMLDGIKKCQSKSSELNECVKSNAHLLWPRLINGVKEFDIPPIDPFNMKDFDISYNGILLNGNFFSSNVTVFGLADLLIKSVDVKISNKKVTVKEKISLPKLRIKGNYSGKVTVAKLSVKPKGGFNLLLEDLDVETKTEAEISFRDGHTFAKVTDINVEPKVGKFHLEVDELVLYSVLSKALINRANKDWRIYYNAIMPQTRKHWQPYIVELVNKLLNVMPLENGIDL